jgi:hypothetical protein
MISLLVVLVPILELQHALLTLEMLEIKECTPTPFSSVIFIFELTFESLKEFGGVLDMNIQNFKKYKFKFWDSHLKVPGKNVI